MTIYYLMVKTHNITGLKYLCKTNNKNPFKYKGSGVYWKKHIKKYGCDVTTEILKECQNIEELKHWGLYYSKFWNVVASKDWANLVEETGQGSGSHWKGKTKSKKIGEKVSLTIKTNRLGKAYKQSGSNNHMYGKKGQLHHAFGKPRSENTCKLISKNHKDVAGANNPKARKIKIISCTGEEYFSHGNLSELCQQLGLSVNTTYIMLAKGRTTFVRGKFKGYQVHYID